MQPGAWNRVGILRKLLRANSPRDAEWILWMDPEVLFDDISFTLPFDMYHSADLVVPDAEAARVKSEGSLHGKGEPVQCQPKDPNSHAFSGS